MKMTQFELEVQWLTVEGLPGVSYRFGDLVRITTGEYSGRSGEVISLIAMEPEPTYLVEMRADDKSIVRPQCELEATGTSTGRTLKLFPPDRNLPSTGPTSDQPFTIHHLPFTRSYDLSR